jgi:hypothetical protein
MSMQAIVPISLAIWEFLLAQISHWHLTKHKGLQPASSIRNNTLGLSLTSHLHLCHLTYFNWSWVMKLVIASVGANNSSPSFCFLKTHVLNLKHHISNLLTPLTNNKGILFWHVISSSMFTQMLHCKWHWKCQKIMYNLCSHVKIIW